MKVELSRKLRKEMTPAERVLWEKLRGSRLDGLRFRRQQVIAGLVVDFYCHEAGLAIELDGGIHDLQRNYDHEKDRVLGARGLRVLRIRNEEVEKDLPEVLERIKTACIKAFTTG